MTRKEAIKILRGRIKMLHDMDPRRKYGMTPYESNEEKLFKVCLEALKELEKGE